MKEAVGKNQTYARYLNNKLVMHELRENGACSATMLAKKLDLSNAAMSAIIDELRNRVYIREAQVGGPVGVGRRPVYWTINGDLGCVAVISLTDYVARVVVSDMDMNITDCVETHVKKYDVAMLYELVLAVKNLLDDKKYKGMPLMTVEFSLPGRVNMATGELQLSPQFDRELFSEDNFIVNLFSRQFNVPVKLNNDINLAAIGEQSSGLLKNVENGMVAHIDEGIGSALVINGKLYRGSTGFAGELGLLRAQLGGELSVLDELVSLRAVRGKVSEMMGRSVTGAELEALYRNDKAVHAYIQDTAVCLGGVLKDIVELLDISTIVLSGKMIGFGADYVDAINAEVSKAMGACVCLPSRLESEAVVRGGIYKAVEAVTDRLFR